MQNTNKQIPTKTHQDLAAIANPAQDTTRRRRPSHISSYSLVLASCTFIYRHVEPQPLIPQIFPSACPPASPSCPYRHDPSGLSSQSTIRSLLLARTHHPTREICSTHLPQRRKKQSRSASTRPPGVPGPTKRANFSKSGCFFSTRLTKENSLSSASEKFEGMGGALRSHFSNDGVSMPFDRNISWLLWWENGIGG